MKSTDFSKPAHYDFARKLEAANGHRGNVHIGRIFEDFLTLASCAYRQAVYKFRTGTQDAEIETEYTRVAKEYPKAGEFASALAIMTMALEVETYDFLGAVYMELNQSNKNTGQFFTPQSLSDATARMVLGEDVKSFHEKYSFSRRCTIDEPCVGGGSMLIAVVKLFREMNVAPWQWWFEATDVDPMCIKMAYIQLTLLGAPGDIYCGNTLGADAGKGSAPWRTMVGALHPIRREQWGMAQPTKKKFRLGLQTKPLIIQRPSFRLPLQRPVIKSST